MPYMELPHTADIRVKISSNSLEGLFFESFLALYSIIFGEHKDCTGVEKGEFKTQGNDRDILLHDFLDEILYITLVKEREICNLNITAFNNEQVTAKYLYKNLERESIKREVKAITYHNLHIVKNDGIYETEVIMDV